MKKLIVCNTVYQVFVALWLKQTILANERVDVIVSDHMVGGDNIAKRIEKTRVFENVYFVESKKLARTPYTRKQAILRLINPKRILNPLVKLDAHYDEIYMANVDRFSQLLYHTIANARTYRCYNSNATVVLYEDGVSTYSKMFGEWYYSCVYEKRKWLPIYQPKTICGGSTKLYVFDKDCLDWDPKIPIVNIAKIDTSNDEFKKIVNYVFSVDESEDVYDTRYLFMEESFFAEDIDVGDVSIVEELSERVGKENVMIKIHPRNPVNRFENLGYRTNKNVSIPWEVIILNQDMNDKVLYTITSSAVLSPARLFGLKPEVHLLYEKLDKIPDILNTGLLDITKNFFERYYANNVN